LTEAHIVDRALTGDETAWSQLVAEHQQAMFRLAYLKLGDADEAEDATQEALIRAHRYLRRFDPNRPLRPWLLAIVSRAAANRRRSAGRYWAAIQRWLAEREVRRPPTPARQTQVSDEGGLWRSVQQLAAIDQDVIYLRYYLDLSVAEAAQALDIAEGTVKSRTSRALERLQELLESDYPEWINE
jgi:RNA polymerase sigma-70 factor (ECF subfamily)